MSFGVSSRPLRKTLSNCLSTSPTGGYFHANQDASRSSLPPPLLIAGAASAQDMVVKIGHVGPTSGAIAHLGKDNENGARMAIDELNAKGVTIGGKKAKFELLAEDDAGDPKQGTAVAQKLVDAKVNGVIGHLNSGTSIPASQDLQRRRHSADLAVGDQPEVHPPGLQDHLPRGGRRRAPGRHARQVRRQGAEGQDHRRHRRPHGLRPGRGRRVREGRQGRRRQDRRRASSPPTRRPTSPPS